MREGGRWKGERKEEKERTNKKEGRKEEREGRRSVSFWVERELSFPNLL